MKKILRFLCIFITSFTLCFISADKVKVYSEDYKLTVSIGEQFASTDYSVRVPVDLSNLPTNGISAMNFVIEFDSDLILNDVRIGGIIHTASDFSYYVKENKVHLLFSDSTSGTNPIKNDGTLCYLYFKIMNSNAKNELTIRRISSSNEIFADNNLNKFSPSFVDGKVMNKDKIYGVSKYKVWRITFNQQVDPSNLKNNSVEVRDSKGIKSHSSFILSNGGKTLEVYAPDGGYEVGKSYTLTIKTTFLSKKGLKLSQEKNIDFYVED